MTIKEAREKINEEFKKDPEFKATYVATINMFLYDHFPDIKISFEKKKNYVNDMSEKLLDLIFGG
jgi:hypothetical protein